jgi:hypothetical protein
VVDLENDTEVNGRTPSAPPTAEVVSLPDLVDEGLPGIAALARLPTTLLRAPRAISFSRNLARRASIAVLQLPPKAFRTAEALPNSTNPKNSGGMRELTAAEPEAFLRNLRVAYTGTYLRAGAVEP